MECNPHINPADLGHTPGPVNTGAAGDPDPERLSAEMGSPPLYSAAYLNSRGLAFETAHRFEDAQRAYRAAMAADARCMEACLNLAALLHRQPDGFDEAVTLCRKALKLNPNAVEAFVLLGCIYQSRSAWDRALNCHRAALTIDPNCPEAHQNLGLILAGLNRHCQAVEHFRKALTRRPDAARTWNDLGISLRACGLLREAAGAYCSAIECRPDFAAAWFHKGNVLQDLRDYDQAAEAYRRAVELDRRLTDAWNNLGVVLRLLKMEDHAADAFREAVQLKPDQPEIHNNLALALEALGQSECAIKHYRRALQLNPAFAEAYRNLGDSLQETGRTADAIAVYRKAVQVRPGFSAAWWNLSLALLQSGQLSEGFSLYHYRRRPELGIFTYPHDLPAPRWDGSPFQDKTLLIYCEQGFGDSIQFCRYLPAARQRGGQVILEAPSALVGLFEASQLADRVIPAGPERPSIPYDLCAPVMDLPHIFGTALKTIPDRSPYLAADPLKIERWHRRIGQGGFKVGLVWAGNPLHGNDKRRSVDVCMFAQLHDVSRDIRFFSLQIGQAASAVRRLPTAMSVEDLGRHLTDLGETAAAMMCLDLIISVDTSVAHLAGALARPTWTLLPYNADWRWLLDRDDSPWYPTMRLFRQRQRDNWAGVFEELRRELRHLCIRRPTGSGL